ncbi:MAG TPA: hypothetical protein VKB35_08545, partial [Ktedonobacteraceae bacterium]|nr:hypothetical protein [Ktedonobacteraceae bacterium]
MAATQTTRADERTSGRTPCANADLTYQTGRTMMRIGGVAIDSRGNKLFPECEECANGIKRPSSGKSMAKLCPGNTAGQIIK